jgi:hypothetical protein
MAGFLLDTNHLSESLRPVSRVRDRIGQLRRLGVRMGRVFPSFASSRRLSHPAIVEKPTAAPCNAY